MVLNSGVWSFKVSGLLRLVGYGSKIPGRKNRTKTCGP